MERLLLLCLLSPLIFAQPHKTKKDLNDEPFLPIHPTYPYSPKLIKRGTERELTSQLTPELYAPKVDAKDSYSSSYSNDYQKDSYYPDYNSYPKDSSPSTYYNNDAYAYANSPYAAYNSYPTPYAMNPAAYSAPPYPNYYYQPHYYYPHYFNHALYASSPPPPSSGVDYQETSQDSTEAEDDKRNTDERSKKPKEDETNRDASTSQFVDGGNYVSDSSRDLDGQSSTYKIPSPYNQVERDAGRAKSLPIPLPRTTYRVISVAGQPVGPDYPLPATYVKAQQMEQLTSETLAKLLAQAGQQAYENNRDTSDGANDGASYANQDAYNSNTPSYATLPSARTAKTGVTYVINTDGTTKVNGERANRRDTPSQRTSNKSTKYSNVYYNRKPALQATLDQSQTTYVSGDNRDKHRDRGRPADQTDEYGGYDGVTQNYGVAYGQSSDKEQNYRDYQSQPDPYQGKDFAVASQTPRSYSYQYSAYESDQAQQPQQDKTNSNDGNFGAKQYNKG